MKQTYICPFNNNTNFISLWHTQTGREDIHTETSTENPRMISLTGTENPLGKHCPPWSTIRSRRRGLVASLMTTYQCIAALTTSLPLRAHPQPSQGMTWERTQMRNILTFLVEKGRFIVFTVHYISFKGPVDVLGIYDTGSLD